MLYPPDRSSLRRFLIEAWRKKQEGAPLEPLENEIAFIAARHPEYHALLEDEAAIDIEFGVSGGQSNPFLHMAMHIAIQEQVSTNRPQGIRPLYAKLTRHFGDPHELEHAMMECLGQSLWQAQRSGNLPDEGAYLECVRALKRQAARVRD